MMQPELNLSHKPDFDGADIDQGRDKHRLTGQILRVYGLMKDGVPRNLGQISYATGDPEASISAQLRNLRKKKFGSHTIKKEYVKDGLYKYKLIKEGI